ncbi:MAG: DNA oxidative demethylase AlkB [Methylophilaceae bacterium]
MTADLFNLSKEQIKITDGAYYLREFALSNATDLCQLLDSYFLSHPPQQMMTPMGHKMSVRTSSFGQFGWVGTKNGYGYAKADPITHKPWPVIPDIFLALADDAAAIAGYRNFVPDTCLVNVYEIGSKMGLHQDKDEQDFSQPIVSVSLGLPATFQFGGQSRTAPVLKIPLTHGDVVVWGADSRRYFHGVLPLKAGSHAILGKRRINLTFRKAGKM